MLFKGDQDPLLSALLRLTGFIVFLGMAIMLYTTFRPHMLPLMRKGETPDISSYPSGSGSTLTDSNGIHLATGFVYAPGIIEMQRHCMGCHSPKLITQFRATREGWQQVIRWMQSTQGLWDLGEDESAILDYLGTYYAPEERGRRANLDQEAIRWYVLEE